MAEVEVVGVDHLYVAVRGLECSQGWYDRVMKVLGFRKLARPLAGGDLHVHYFNLQLQYTLRPAAPSARDHDPYSPGLHHLCFRVATREAVDQVARELEAAGIETTKPREYPEYHEDYYATFFEDPDGLRLEVVNEMEMRRATVRHWDSIPPIGS